jgi:hypothetical protein
MLNSDYLLDSSVDSFVNWLAIQLSSLSSLPNYNLGNKASSYINNFHSALQGYSWPTRSTLIYLPMGSIAINSRASFQVNNALLATMSKGLNKALMYRNDAEFRQWLIAVFHWGGVRNHNVNWASTFTNPIGEISTVLAAIKNLVDDNPEIKVPTPFRFNSGMSKVYSLLNDDLIIYDSRVARALACLVLAWQKSNRKPDSSLGMLKLRMPPGRGSSQNPKPEIFHNMNNSASRYLTWTIRASWIVNAAVTIAGPNYNLSSTNTRKLRVREVEAALFMLGK